MQSVKRKTSFDAFHPFSQYLDAVAFAIGMTDTCGGPPTYLVNDIRWAFDSPQAVSEAVPKAMHDIVATDDGLHPFVQRSTG